MKPKKGKMAKIGHFRFSWKSFSNCILYIFHRILAFTVVLWVINNCGQKWGGEGNKRVYSLGFVGVYSTLIASQNLNSNWTSNFFQIFKLKLATVEKKLAHHNCSSRPAPLKAGKHLTPVLHSYHQPPRSLKEKTCLCLLSHSFFN